MADVLASLYALIPSDRPIIAKCMIEAGREIEQLRARISQLETELNDTHRVLTASNAALNREHNERLRLTAENAGLREDRERLDWLELNLGELIQLTDDGVFDDDLSTVRAVIDGARGAK